MLCEGPQERRCCERAVVPFQFPPDIRSVPLHPVPASSSLEFHLFEDSQICAIPISSAPLPVSLFGRKNLFKISRYVPFEDSQICAI